MNAVASSKGGLTPFVFLPLVVFLNARNACDDT